MIESNVSFDNDGNTLDGTVCLPDGEGSVPVVLFVHGSGPLDRNENTSRGELNVFNQMAHYLSEHGIGSFRYDKRGCGRSTGDYLAAGHHDFVSDAEAAVCFLLEKDFGKQSEIFVVGHSEGSLIAPQVAKKQPAVAGILLLCPFSQPLKQVLKSQAKRTQDDILRLGGIKGMIVKLAISVLGDPVSSQQKLIKKIEQSTEPCLRHGLKKVNAKWFRDLFEIDMQDAYTNIPCPVLVIGGEKDIQCDPSDVEQIKAWLDCNGTEVEMLADMTHILRRDAQSPSILRYQELLKEDVDEELLQVMRHWILRYTNTER